MMNNTNKVLFISAFLFIAAIPGPSFSEQAGHQHASPAPSTPASGSNPLIEEMVQLDSVYKDIVSAVALGDNSRVHKALESMHGAMEKTHEGVHAGTVTIPKNAARIKEFVSMDTKFHEKLEALSRAAHRNNQKEMLRITKQLLDGCVQCHQTFRK